MTLDLAATSRQLRAMAENLAATEHKTEALLDEAVAQLESCSTDFHDLRARVEDSKVGWPVARPLDSPRARYPLPETPTDYAVVATDGSQIEPDRHGPVLCYLINTGSVLLRYGSDATAALSSEPFLGYREEDLYITEGEGQTLISGDVLSVRRSVKETQMLAERSCAAAAEGRTVAVQDGTLVLWTAQRWSQEKSVRDYFLEEYLGYLDLMRKAGVAVSSYISRPRATDVVNLLRLITCPHPIPNCKNLCADEARRKEQQCARLAGMHDQAVFARHLRAGERSALFLSSAPSSLSKYGPNKVCFFYVNVGPEIARVEVPEWLALDSEQVAFVHAALYDQARRGDGYPRVLIEAHEKAVITSGERQQFEELLSVRLGDSGLARNSSQKQRSKRLRGL